MNKSRNITLLILAMVTGLWAFWELRIYASSMGGVGPDVIVGDIPSIDRWGSSGNETSFSIGTTSCNVGDTRLDWIASTNVHPVISQNLYRVNNGRIEQIGMSWLKHGFAVAAGSYCNQCTMPSSVYLGVGCSDPYSAGLNGSQGRLGPRSEVNASTGIFLMPHGSLPQNGVLDGRLRVENSYIDPSQNAGARYFVEAQYIHPQDAAAGNGNNNASFREAFVSVNGSSIDINTSGSSPTVRQKPGITAWQSVNPDVHVMNVDIPGDGRVFVGMRTTPNQTGGFHTEIAVENMNSHRSVGSLGIRFGSGSVANEGFHDMDYQFEPFSNSDWAPSVNGNEIVWSTQSFTENEDANALRWATMYSFWCDSDTRPAQLTIGVFRPGTPTEIMIDVSNAVLPESVMAIRGNLVSGGTEALADSDDVDLSMQRATSDIQARTEFEASSFSPTASPSFMEVTLEGSVFARSQVDQSIELYNYTAGGWEQVDARAATMTVDSTVTVLLDGDLSRFVEPGTLSVHARISYQSTVARQQFSSNTDQFIWTIGQ